MKISNEKTGVVYLTSIEKWKGSYHSKVFKNDNAGGFFMVSLEKFDTYGKAYRYACKACKSHAANHAYLN